MEAAMDDLADKLGIDPLEFRLENLADGEFRTPIYEEGEVKQGAELIGWVRRAASPAARTAAAPFATAWARRRTSGVAAVLRTRR